MTAIDKELRQHLWINGRLHLAILTASVNTLCILLDLRHPGSLLTAILAASAIASSSLCNLMVPLLRILKMEQIIRKDGPIGHYGKKHTPTMGGIVTILIGLLIGILSNNNNSNKGHLLAIVITALIYLGIGSLDDWKSLTNNTNIGLTAKGKLALQSFGAIVFLSILAQWLWTHDKIGLPVNYNLSIGILLWPFILFVLLAESNSANLTDGLDGLLAGCGAIILSGLIVQLVLCGSTNNISMASFCASMTGSWLGFLSLNRYPARVFMGDAGSLTLGVLIITMAILTDTLWPLFLMSGVLLMESVSVIIQVGTFSIIKRQKQGGKRLFRMTPLHHHFELGGIDEAKIVVAFWLTSFFLLLVSIVPLT
ncbi:MAG TPA: phospho-N-acetylmuramoyl-pentapeptide-transferase [Prochlorococcaceae cyanobacterium AMR_MDS_5431]|nr:phospho-N-acetylmuramoyl-pentapeptide-transferase [Prochlorococcaceae cyanobacterium AMR_MDS_5431]